MKRIFRSRSRECFRKLHSLQKSRRGKLAVLLVVLWILFIVYSSQLQNDTETRQRLLLEVFTQSDLTYFARYIKVYYRVLENDYKEGDLYRAEITLSNTGDQTFPWEKWSIYFCQVYIVEPENYPYPDGIDLPESGIRFFNLGGGIYRMEPIAKVFPAIEPGQSRSVYYTSDHYSVAKMDVYPNWYFAVEGLEPRIIENTKGESYDWIAPYNTPNLWKRWTLETRSLYDRYDPFTPLKRYQLKRVENQQHATLPVIPVPVLIDKYEPINQVNVRSGNWLIVAPSQMGNEATYLADIWNLQVVRSQPTSKYISFVEEDIKVTDRGREMVTDESYELRVDPQREFIIIKASKTAGIFYGIQTLLSLADAQGNIPKIRIQDGPRYEYRGVMLDVARNFLPKEDIFRYLDIMAMYKLNKFHFHLTDDEGWRLAIPGLPELTQIGATRCHDPSQTKCLFPYLGSGPFVGLPGSGFYTEDDYKAILLYAAARHIEVIPEIDMPGHSHAAITAMNVRVKRLKDQGVNQTEQTKFMLQDIQDQSHYKSVQNFENNAINPCLQSTYNFISLVVNTLYTLHRDINPLKKFHFGGDEVPSKAWARSPVCERLRKTGVNVSLDDYLAIQISKMTALYNLDLAGWEDGLWQSKTPIPRAALRNRNVYAYSWNNIWEWGGAAHAYKFANNGYKVVLTPATNLYLDHPYEPDPEERGLYWASRYSDSFSMYSIMPENIFWNALTMRSGQEFTNYCEENDCPTLITRSNIAGIQGTLFGEMLRSPKVTDEMLMPRLIALADRAWHQTSWEFEKDKRKRNNDMKADWVNFANTVGHKELARLDTLGFKYHIPVPGASVFNGLLHVSLNFPGLPVEVSDNGGITWMDVNSSYVFPIEMGKNYSLRTRSASGQRYSRIVTVSETKNSGNSSVISGLWVVCVVVLHLILTSTKPLC